MLQTIITAVSGRHILTLVYKGMPRTVEPHAVGRTKAGNDVVRCFQTGGQHNKDWHDWDLLTIERIEQLQPTGQSFSGPRPDYQRDDKAMAHIYAQL